MLSSDETKAGGKPRKAKPGADKAREKRRKAVAQVAEPDRPDIAAPDIAAQDTGDAVALTETAAPVPSPADTAPTVPAAAEDSAPVNYRTLADAWGNYSRTSLEQTRAYFEKLAGVRSLGAAFEVQAEFARQACETFVAQSQKIGELQGELTKQRLKRLEGFMEKMTQGTRQN